MIIGCFHGIVHPALFFMFKNWFPNTEQTVALSLLLVGNALGLILNVPLSAFVFSISSPIIPNWSFLFYGGSLLHLVWLFLWTLWAADIPETHKSINEKEIFYIRQNSNNILELNNRQVPWRRIFKSKVLYASIVAKICWSFNNAIIIDNGPSYLNQIYGYNMVQASWYVAFVYLITVIVFLLSGPLFNILDHSLSISHTRLRKIFQMIVFLGSSITMCALAAWLRCDSYQLKILIIVNMITQGFTTVGEFPMINEFAGYYSGTVYGIAVTFDSFARFIASTIRGELVGRKMQNWNIVFYITGALNLIGLIIFELYASTSLRNWAIRQDLFQQLFVSNTFVNDHTKITHNQNQCPHKDSQNNHHHHDHHQNHHHHHHHLFQHQSCKQPLKKPIKKEIRKELRNPHFRQDIDTETEDWKEFKSSTLVK
ncbi:Sialin [Sarcoptes scabiei]|nr:Sialin [Sarcoptes scabiei]